MDLSRKVVLGLVCASGLSGVQMALAGTVTTDGPDLVINTNSGLESKQPTMNSVLR